jgi:hypothetical protein
MMKLKFETGFTLKLKTNETEAGGNRLSPRKGRAGGGALST